MKKNDSEYIKKREELYRARDPWYDPINQGIRGFRPKDGSLPAKEKLDLGYTLKELSRHSDSLYNIRELLELGYTRKELLEAGFNSSQIERIMKDREKYKE